MKTESSDKNETVIAQTAFDAYAEDYEAALAKGLSVSGESKDYFAEGRVRWLSGRLQELGVTAELVMDFGCGTGSATPFLLQFLGARQVLGVDISLSSLTIARDTYGSASSRFTTLEQHSPCGEIDLVFCNGVFHHILPGERAGAIDHILRSLKPGGIFAFWENNPWNLGTRYIMKRIPFDKDAVTLTPPEARALLARGGFEVLRTDYLFIFPNALRFLRALEPPLSPLPLGAQYLTLCRKP